MTNVHLEAARRRRDEILATKEFLDEAAARELLGEEPRELRKAARILGLWDGSRFLYPAFQCDGPTRAIRRGVTELLALLPRDRSGWRQAFWIYQPHALLAGRTPAEVLASNPPAVIAAARSTFEPGDTNW